MDFYGSCCFSSFIQRSKWLQKGVKPEPSDGKAALPSILLPCVPGVPGAAMGRAEVAGIVSGIVSCTSSCASVGVPG